MKHIVLIASLAGLAGFLALALASTEAAALSPKEHAPRSQTPYAGRADGARESVRPAGAWGRDADAMAPPEISERAALDPYGPTLIASRPVPDTPRNRVRYGMPMSRAGKLTPPIGD